MPSPSRLLSQQQQNVWAEELRRADERALKFKQDLADADAKRIDMEKKLREMDKALQARDQEIQRLALLYKGGQNFDTVKDNYDKQTAQNNIVSLQK